jgi:hypothetical protein
MSKKSASLSIPQVGMEIVPLASLTRIPIPLKTTAFPRIKLLGGSILGPLVVCAVYQAVLTVLRTESGVRLGEINRRRQLALVVETIFVRTKGQGSSSLQMSVLLSILRLLLPSISFPLGILGFLAVGKVCERTFNAYWESLNHGQKAEMRRKVFAAGMNFRYRVDGNQITLES